MLGRDEAVADKNNWMCQLTQIQCYKSKEAMIKWEREILQWLLVMPCCQRFIKYFEKTTWNYFDISWMIMLNFSDAFFWNIWCYPSYSHHLLFSISAGKDGPEITGWDVYFVYSIKY